MKTIRVAVMLAVSSAQQRVIGAAIAKELKKRDYVGKVSCEIFFTSFDDGLMREQFANMVNDKFDVIFTMGTAASVTLRNFYDEFPVDAQLPVGIFAGVRLPVDQGVIASVKQPGGRMTGIMREGAPPFLHARFIEEMPFKCKRIAILHSRYGECGYIAGKACMTQGYLEKRGFFVDLYPIEGREEVLGTMHQLMRDNAPDMVLTFEGCSSDRYAGQISDICAQNNVHYFGDGTEAIMSGALFGFGGGSAVFAQKAIVMFRKMVTKKLDPATTPVVILPNNRQFYVNHRALEDGLVTKEWIARMEKKLDVRIIVKKER